MLDLMHPVNSGRGGRVKSGIIPADDDGTVKLGYRIDSIAPGRDVYDENTGEILDPTQVKAARALVIDFNNRMNVWEIRPRPPKSSPTKIVRGRWVDIDKGKIYRSRFVAMEIKGGVKSAFAPEFFAAMPPLSSSMLLCIFVVTQYFPGADGKLLSIAAPELICIDVRRAHFVSWARRDIAVEFPEELRKPGEDLVGYLEMVISRRPCMALVMPPPAGKKSTRVS
jgi:hypothetical protein